MDFRWNEWNIDHIAKHGVDPLEAEFVVRNAKRPYPLRTDEEKWLVRGRGRGGRPIQVVFIVDEDKTVFVIRPPARQEKGEAAISPWTMIKRASKPSKPYTKMNTRELAEATAEFDQPGIPPGFKPLDAAGRALWASVNANEGVPPLAKASK